jgi:microcystin-dependent protein
MRFRIAATTLLFLVFAAVPPEASSQTPFVGQVRIFAGNFAPVGWAFCDGQLLAISQYETLFNLIGTTYGGDGVTTFALPDLRGRVALGTGTGPGLSSYSIGQQGGEETVTLTTSTIPSHNHVIEATQSPGTSASPAGAVPAVAPDGLPAMVAPGPVPNDHLTGIAVIPAGGGQAHDNIKPYTAVRFIIALEGIFPSRP